MEETCGTCFCLGEEIPGQDTQIIGEAREHFCRRNPPSVHMVPVPHPLNPGQLALQQLQAFPRVRPTDACCGEWASLGASESE